MIFSAMGKTQHIEIGNNGIVHESSCYLLTSLTLCNHYLFISIINGIVSDVTELTVGTGAAITVFFCALIIIILVCQNVKKRIQQKGMLYCYFQTIRHM